MKILLLVLLSGASAQEGPFKDTEGPAIAAKPAAGPAVLGPLASKTYTDAVLGKARSRLLSQVKISDDKPCSTAGVALAFLKAKNDQTVDLARWTKEVEAAAAETEIVFVKNSVRAGWRGEGSPIVINQSAKAIGLTPAMKKKLETHCHCRIGTAGKAAFVIFNNTGDETGYESTPPAKLVATAVHELLHVVLPRFGGVFVAKGNSAHEHGLTEYLGVVGGEPGNYIPWKPAIGSCAL